MELRKAEANVDILRTTYITFTQQLYDLESLEFKEVLGALTNLPGHDDHLEHKSSSESKNGSAENPATAAYQNYDTMIQILSELKEKMEKFGRRLKETDPVTGNRRYGENTQKRVTALLSIHDTINDNLALLSGSLEETQQPVKNSCIKSLKNLAHLEAEEKLMQETRELELHEKNKRLLEAEQEEKRKAEEEAINKLEEEKEARLKAEESARLRQVAKDELEKRLKEEEELKREEEEKARIALIVRGEEGIKIQLDSLYESCKNDKGAYRVALRSLHTMFTQITTRPEEAAFRRVRSNHPKFHDDIGRHLGGRELLIAAGFEITVVDEIPCYVSKEPPIEDFDVWSAWFDGMKKCLELIDHDLIHRAK